MTACDLSDKKCLPCEGGTTPLSAEMSQDLLKNLDQWQTAENQHAVKFIRKKFEFKNYYHTIAFVNAIAFISHRENHHPDLSVGYNSCIVEYTTHAINGLSENDFICASKIDKLFKI